MTRKAGKGVAFLPALGVAWIAVSFGVMVFYFAKDVYKSFSNKKPPVVIKKSRK